MYFNSLEKETNKQFNDIQSRQRNTVKHVQEYCSEVLNTFKGPLTVALFIVFTFRTADSKHLLMSLETNNIKKQKKKPFCHLQPLIYKFWIIMSKHNATKT